MVVQILFLIENIPNKLLYINASEIIKDVLIKPIRL